MSHIYTSADQLIGGGIDMRHGPFLLYIVRCWFFSADGHLTTSENHRRFHGNDLGS